MIFFCRYTSKHFCVGLERRNDRARETRSHSNLIFWKFSDESHYFSFSTLDRASSKESWEEIIIRSLGTITSTSVRFKRRSAERFSLHSPLIFSNAWIIVVRSFLHDDGSKREGSLRDISFMLPLRNLIICIWWVLSVYCVVKTFVCSRSDTQEMLSPYLALFGLWIFLVNLCVTLSIFN